MLYVGGNVIGTDDMEVSRAAVWLVQDKLVLSATRTFTRKSTPSAKCRTDCSGCLRTSSIEMPRAHFSAAGTARHGRQRDAVQPDQRLRRCSGDVDVSDFVVTLVRN
jgi:hypothetical protein